LHGTARCSGWFATQNGFSTAPDGLPPVGLSTVPDGLSLFGLSTAPDGLPPVGLPIASDGLPAAPNGSQGGKPPPGMARTREIEKWTRLRYR
jgi:hypothetical protein